MGEEEFGGLIGEALFSALAAWIFYRAGRSLDPAAGSQWLFASPWLGLTLLTLSLVFLRAYVMPTGAMEDTLLIGDHIFVPRFGATTPSRGDVIVFRYPVDPAQTFVKRVVGIPRDRVRFLDKQLIINGNLVEEPYTLHKTSYVDSYRDNFPSTPNTYVYDQALEMLEKHVIDGEIVVPEGHYFVLGDNRDLSLDSRYWGFVPRENIIGKPWIVYWSSEESTQSELIPVGRSSSSGARWNRIFTLVESYPIQ